MTELLLMLLCVFLLSHCLLSIYRRLALRRHWLDVPNARSSHAVPVPGGAGLCLAIAFLFASVYLFIEGQMPAPILWLHSLSLMMALTGWLDDRLALSRRLRAIIYLLCAVLFVRFGTLESVTLLLLCLALFLFAFVNAFNFMDGIDGIAAAQVLFFALAFQCVAAGDLDSGLRLTLGLMATLAAAFLFWNWSPARVFLGDSGSLFFGFLLAGSAVYADRAEIVPILSSSILLAVFIADSAVTLLARLIGGERIQDAHRTHLYQLLAQHWGSHSRVVLVYSVVNITVLLPIALLSQAHPTWAAILCAVTYAILCAIVWFYRSHLLPSSAEKI